MATVVEGILKLRDTDAKQALSEVADAARKTEGALDGAQDQARATGDALEGMGDRASRAGDQLRGAANNTEHFGDVAGKTDRVASALAGSLGLVSPAAAEAAQGAADVAGGLEAINLLGGAALRVLGPVAIAVGALALAYRTLKADADAAEAAMKAASDEATRMQRLSETTNRARIQAQVASGDLSQEAGVQQLAQMDAQALLGGNVDAERTKLQEYRLEVERLDKAIAEVGRTRQQTSAGFLGDYYPVDEDAVQAQQLKALTAQRAAAQAALDAQGQAVAVAQQAVQAYAADLVTLGTQTDAATAAIQAETTATEELTAAKLQLLNALERLQALEASGLPPEERARLAGEARALDQIDLLAARNEVQDSLAATLDTAPTLSTGLSWQDAQLFSTQVAQGNQAVSAGLQGLGDSLQFELDDETKADLVDAIGTGAAALAAVTAGDMGGMLALTGDPVSAAVGQAVGALQELGDVGAEEVGARIEAGFDSLAAGLEELPELLSEVLPQVLGEGAPKIIDALIAAAPELVVAQYEMLLKLGKAVVLDIPVAIVAGIVDGIERAFERAKEWVEKLLSGELLKEKVADSDWKDVARVAARVGLGVATLGASEIIGRGLESAGHDVPLFHGGGMNDRERLALLYEGERVVPPDTPWTGPSAARQRGDIHLHGPVMGPESVDWVRRQLDQQFGADGPAAGMPVPWGR
jgi:hypothetical protein